MLRLPMLTTVAVVALSGAAAFAQTTPIDQTEPRATLTAPDGRPATSVVTVASTPRPNPPDTPLSQQPVGDNLIPAPAPATPMHTTPMAWIPATSASTPAPEAPPATPRAATTVTTPTDEVEPRATLTAPGGAPAAAVVTTSSAPRPNPPDTPPGQQPTPDRVAPAPATADEVAAPESSTVEAPRAAAPTVPTVEP